MSKVNPNNGNETKLDIFDGTYSNLISLFTGRKILKYFNEKQRKNVLCLISIIKS